MITPKIKNVTTYGLISGFYFRKLIATIVRIGELERPGLKVLDFGCGHGMLKLLYPHINIIGFDVLSELTDVPDWRQVPFDVVVANEVFYSFDAEQLDRLLSEFKAHNKNLELIVGESRQSLLNKTGALLLGYGDAHKATKISPTEERQMFLHHMYIMNQETVWRLADVYRLKFID